MGRYRTPTCLQTFAGSISTGSLDCGQSVRGETLFALVKCFVRLTRADTCYRTMSLADNGYRLKGRDIISLLLLPLLPNFDACYPRLKHLTLIIEDNKVCPTTSF